MMMAFRWRHFSPEENIQIDLMIKLIDPLVRLIIQKSVRETVNLSKQSKLQADIINTEIDHWTEKESRLLLTFWLSLLSAMENISTLDREGFKKHFTIKNLPAQPEIYVLWRGRGRYQLRFITLDEAEYIFSMLKEKPYFKNMLDHLEVIF